MPLKKQARKERFVKIIKLLAEEKNSEAFNELVIMCGEDTGLFVMATYEDAVTSNKKPK